MRNLTIDEAARLNIAGKHQSASEWFTLSLWSIFYPKRLNKFLDCINKGMSWYFSKIEAKK